jgi:hypothetical protein
LECSGERRRGWERKTLDPAARSGELAIKRQATWGMSDDVLAELNISDAMFNFIAKSQ